MNSDFLIVDGSSLIFRAFYALPLLKNKKGLYTNAIYGFLSMFLKLKGEAEYVAVLFDKKAPTFRHKEYKEYKGTRSETPSELLMQFPILTEILENFGVKCLAMDGFEADDLAGTLSRLAEEKNLNSLLLTGDKDYLQLASKKTIVRLTKKGITQTVDYDEEKIIEEYGITPAQLIELKALMGDSSDNIPGVKGVGEKTGIKLVKQFGTLENLYENIDEVQGEKLKEKLKDGMQSAFLSRRLGKILREVPIDENLETYKIGERNDEFLREKFEELEFQSLMNYLSKDTEKTQINYDYVILKREEIINKLAKKRCSCVFFTDTGDYKRENVFALSFAVDTDKAFLHFMEEGESLNDYKGIFQDNEVLTYGAKEFEYILRREGIENINISGDVSLLGYLLDPSSTYSLDNLTGKYLEEKGINLEELQGKGAKRIPLSEVSKNELMEYMAFSALSVLRLHSEMLDRLPTEEMKKLYYNMELPLSSVLCDFEISGFRIDTDKLSDLKKSFQNELDNLTSEIYNLSGEEFNINSTKQLGEILFDRLKLPIIKKTKTGYSTDVSVLEALYGEHPIIEKLLRYRQVSKLQSTYVEGLLNAVNPETGRIYSTFNQTVTQTGRISSQDPNLQNISVKSEDGKKIREVFVAKEGCLLVDLDYSQIELRVLAEMCGDENLLEAFKQGIDIHRKTASEVLHKPVEEVTPLERSHAKAVNFGIIYGISDFGLSKQLNISRKEAKEYIENYFAHFPKIKNYMDTTKKFAKKNGYVETLFNRRRYIPEINAKNFNIRSFGERIAMNTPIQGTAADIIKLAMVGISRELKERNFKSELILQVHDELILECPENEASEVGEMAKNIMENIVDFDIKLEADMGIGKNWNEIK